MKTLTSSRPASSEDWPLGVECAWPAAQGLALAEARPAIRRRWPLWRAAVAFAVSLRQLGCIRAKAWPAQRPGAAFLTLITCHLRRPARRWPAALRRHRPSHLKGDPA